MADIRPCTQGPNHLQMVYEALYQDIYGVKTQTLVAKGPGTLMAVPEKNKQKEREDEN